MKRMSWFSFLIYHCILVDIALALAIAGNQAESKESHVNVSVADRTTLTTLAPETTTTEMPKKEDAEEMRQKKPEADAKQNETLEKPLPKKRGVLQDLYYKKPTAISENGFDMNDESVPEELFARSRPDPDERSFFRSNGYGDSVYLNDDGYFENDGRSKRTAILDGIYNGPQDYSKPEIELSPDEVIALLSLLEERRLYNNAMQNRWPGYDNTIDSIEADMRDEDMYRDRDGDRMGEIYDGDRDSLVRYPTGMKRYMISKRLSDHLGNPKLKIPVFRRSVL